MSKLKYVNNVDWKDRLFGIKCPHCNKRGTDMRSNTYTRGWNNLCEQASGSDGFFCMGCNGITFLTSYEEARRTTPTWCTVLPDSARCKWFPDFKHNRSVAHVATHHSHTIYPLPEPLPEPKAFNWWPEKAQLIRR